MFLLDRFLVGGLGFVLDKVAGVVDAQMNDEDTLRQRLLDAQLRFELGEIDDVEFRAREAEALAGLREIQERKRGGSASPRSIATDDLAEIEVSFGGDEDRR
jgi:hypothetical protein